MNGLKISKLLFALLTILLLTSCGGIGTSHIPPLLFESEMEEPDTVLVTRGTVENLTIEQGITRFPTVSAHLETGSGFIKTVYAMPGDIVYEGQVIARLDTPELDEMIELLEGSIANELRLHQLFLRESSALIELQSTSGSNGHLALLRLERRHAIARHEIEMEVMEARLNNLLERREHAEITSPIDGEVIFTLLPGTWVNALDAVSHIALSGGLYVEYIGIPQLVWGYERIQGVIDGVVYDLTLSRLSRAERAAAQNLGIPMPVRFSIDTESPDLLGAGKTVFILRYISHAEDTLRLPSYAVLSPRLAVWGDTISYVYRLDNGNQEIVYVTTGIVTDQYTEILHGLDEGDEIVVRR
jgi:multidrug efflux pump subunit AcrA (membrane-fusion protein)